MPRRGAWPSVEKRTSFIGADTSAEVGYGQLYPRLGDSARRRTLLQSTVTSTEPLGSEEVAHDDSCRDRLDPDRDDAARVPTGRVDGPTAAAPTPGPRAAAASGVDA